LIQLKYSQIIALIFWATMIGTMVIEVGLELPWTQSSGFAGLTTLLFAGFAFGWVRAHSRENDIQVPGTLKIGVVLLAAVAVPYYKFKYFGAKSGLLFVGILALCFILTIILSGAITALILPDYSVFE
jgi:peptidoglycan/LPS O-acetylase OafA/YrhL